MRVMLHGDDTPWGYSNCACTSNYVSNCVIAILRFKGVMGHHAVCSVTTQRTRGRVFNTAIKKSKGELVQNGLGPLFRVQLSPHPEVTLSEEL
jgi:hypothetical protein